MPVVASRTENTKKTVAYNSLIIALFSASILTGTHAFAQNAPETTQTSELVLPKDEATHSKTGQDVPPLASQEQNTGSLSGAFLSSYVAHSEGNLSQALKYLRDAYAKDPQNTQIAGQILVLDLTLGNMQEALEIATKLKKTKNPELIVNLILAIESVKNDKPAAGGTTLKAAASDSFDHIWLPLLLEWMSDPANNKEVKVETIVPDANDIPGFVYYHAGLLNDLRGHTDLAEKYYQEAILDLERAPFRALLAYINLKTRQQDKERLQQLVFELKQNRPDMVELLLSEAPYLATLGSEEALPDTRFIANSKEGTAEVLLTMASMLYTLDISQDIPLYLQMAIYLRPDFPTAQLMLGNYFESLKLWPEAIEQYKAIRTTSPLYLKSAIRRLHVVELRGDENEASQLTKQLTQQFPNSIDAWVAAGDVERGRAQFEDAIRYYNEAIRLLGNDPQSQHWFLYFARGASYERLKQWDKAEADLRAARNLSPEQPEILNYIGYMWLEQDKKIFESVKLIEKAYKLSPHEPHIIDSLGWAYYKIGKLDKAIALLEHAAEMMPNDPTINEHLGDSYWHKNRILEARYQWIRAKDFAEDAEQTERLEKKIADGLSTYSFHTPPIDEPYVEEAIDIELPKSGPHIIISE